MLSIAVWTATALLLSVAFLPITTAQPTFKVALVKDLFLKYAFQDDLIYNGTLWWAEWVNSRGGLQHFNGVANISRNVEIITYDASTPNPNKTVALVTQGYEEMVTKNTIDLMVSPVSSDRTGGAMSVAQNHSIINLAVAAQSDALFKSTTSFTFATGTPTALIPIPTLDLMIKKGAKNFTLFNRADKVCQTVGDRAIDYLLAHGVTMISRVWINTTTTDFAALDTVLREAISTHLSGTAVDLFIYTSLSGEYSNIVSAFDHARPPNVKAAVFMIGSSRFEQQISKLGNVGDGWVTSVRFDPSLSFGVSGVDGGTTAEFLTSFRSRFGVTPSHYDALAAAMLMTYSHAVNLCNSIDASVVRATMKSMPMFETFAFPAMFFNNGTNVYPQLVPIQYVNGEGTGVTPATVQYPVEWYWLPKENVYPLRETAASLKGGLAVVIVIGFLVGAFAVTLLILRLPSFRKKFGLFYCSVFLSGVMLSFVASAILLPKPTNALCVVFPWLLGIAFTLTYGCLFIKTWILYRIWRTSIKLKRTRITTETVIQYVGVALVVELILLIIWTVVDPPTVHVSHMVDDTLQSECKSKSAKFWIVFIAMKGTWLVFGAVISALTRTIAKEYNHYNAIGYAIYSTMVLFVISIPLVVSLENVRDITVIIKVIVIVLAFTFTCVILFFDTWQQMLFGEDKLTLHLAEREQATRTTNSTSENSKSSDSAKTSSLSQVTVDAASKQSVTAWSEQ